MIQAVFGFFGAIIGAVALAIAGSVAAVIFFILWKSGTLGDAWDVVKAFVSGGWDSIKSFFGFLGELVKASAP